MYIPVYQPGDARNMGRVEGFYLLFLMVLSLFVNHNLKIMKSLQKHTHTSTTSIKKLVLWSWLNNKFVV